MHDLASVLRRASVPACFFSEASNRGNVSPPRPIAPIWSKSRRAKLQVAITRPILRPAGPLANLAEVRQLRPRPRSIDQIADQIDRLELGISHVQARRVPEKFERAAALDRRLDRRADRPQEPFELPPPRAKRPDVADRAHRHFNQPAGILV